MGRYFIYILLIIVPVLLSVVIHAQSIPQPKKDTSCIYTAMLDDVTVTATRSEKKLGNVAVPVSIITKKRIEQSGSVKLNDILGEQAGLFITTNQFGTGIQMQGLNADYTLILINGEPVIGRNGGVLDLSRITTGNIKKIEIVKGPSSSLYGSEALAGVINIITETPVSTEASASIRYATFGTTDINTQGSYINNKLKASLQGNYYSTKGYKLDENAVSNTQDPFRNYSLQCKGEYAFTANTKWALNARLFDERQNIAPYKIKDNTGNDEIFSANQSVIDNAINNAIEHRFSKKTKSALRISFTNYKAVSNRQYSYTDDSKNYTYYDYFKENVLRIENQTDWNINNNMKLTAGAGGLLDKVSSNRYDDITIVSKNNSTAYIYTQHEWTPAKTWLVITGARFDYNQKYQSAFTPKIAIQKKIGDNLSINVSIGKGFKAPEFSKLYLNFTNNAGGGYTVLGNAEVHAGINQMQQQGLIQSILIEPSLIDPLKPETSTGINIGANYTHADALSVNINLFRNDITNLINTGNVAQKTNNAFVYSYFNINKVMTQGAEATINIKLFKNMQASAGYQLLYSADKDVLQQVKNGNIFGRNNGVVYQVTTKEYYGLYNRSRHTANCKFFYENDEKWFANIRLLYRSSWGIADKDGNKAYNRGDKTAQGFTRANCSIGKSFLCGIKLQAGCDNMFNYRDKENLPNLPGRIFYTTIGYSFKNKFKN